MSILECCGPSKQKHCQCEPHCTYPASQECMSLPLLPADLALVARPVSLGSEPRDGAPDGALWSAEEPWEPPLLNTSLMSVSLVAASYPYNCLVEAPDGVYMTTARRTLEMHVSRPACIKLGEIWCCGQEQLHIVSRG